MLYQFDTAQVCLNGHLINSASNSWPLENKNFCPACSQRTITACPSCNSVIKGVRVHGKMVYKQADYHVNRFCDECGTAYPWTEKSKQTAYDLIEYSDLATTDKQDLMSTVVDLIDDGPKTPLAILKYKDYVQKAGVEIGKGLRDILIEVVSESVKKLIWAN